MHNIKKALQRQKQQRERQHVQNAIAHEIAEIQQRIPRETWEGFVDVLCKPDVVGRAAGRLRPVHFLNYQNQELHTCKRVLQVLQLLQTKLAL